MTDSMQKLSTEVVVIGGGPGGYTAAFRAADLGKKVTLVEQHEKLGGVCLNVGCIPSKTLLHAAKVIDEAASFKDHGITFSAPEIDIKRLRAWKDSVINQLTTGLKGLAKQRKVTVVQGRAGFESPHELKVQGPQGETRIEFKHAVIAVGSHVIKLPFLPEDPRIMDSTSALQLEDIPPSLLVIGGGIIGLEMATVYQALGSKVTVVELTEGLLPGADRDLVKPLHKRMEKMGHNFLLKTKVARVEARTDGLWVSFEGEMAPSDKPVRFDKILSAVGRAPNGHNVQADKAGVSVDGRGFIKVDRQQRTNVEHIYAIGDVGNLPMLAHKAMPEGRVAAEVIAGKKHYFEPLAIASVAYTDPEVAWVGLTETGAEKDKVPYEKGSFPWMANGRSISQGRTEGLTKVLFDPKTKQIIGAGIVGPNAGELIAEMALAIEMGCDAEDVALTIHPHPTLSETSALAVEAFEGTITDLYLPKK